MLKETLHDGKIIFNYFSMFYDLMSQGKSQENNKYPTTK